ncbi:thiamine biosynthesis protein ThiF [compost metagenome]
MIWWASQPSRARSERLAIADLAEQHGWLTVLTWRLTSEGRLCCDLDIDRLGKPVPLTLTYPNYFPDMPPQVTPRDGVRLSDHQYGAGGELCLEYRTDNWEPSFTGAMMLESAFRLLTGEAPTEGETATVATAHRTTMGQQVRSAIYRFIVSEDARKALAAVPILEAQEAEIVEQLSARKWMAFPSRIGGTDTPYWSDTPGLPDLRTRKGFFVRLPPALRAAVTAEYDVVEALVEVMKREDATARLAKSDEELIFITESDGLLKLVSVSPGEGNRVIYDYATVAVPAEQGRLSSEYTRLAKASVAIIGCGSVGSKIAASLARAGVGKFVLVDGDVLFPGNLVRNELDWRGVGLNKPDALKTRIEEVAVKADVKVYRIALGGQESSGSTDAALVAAGKCDVIIDATADPEIFNLCAAVARNDRKPLVWGQVFGGGIGGLIARLRPDLDPVPHAARRQISDWCAERGQALPTVGDADVQYGLTLDETSPPLIADDADVTLIAGHMTRLALDILLLEATLFPQSAYAIGLKPGWIFEAPFDTWPITLVPEGTWGPVQDEDLSQQLEAFTAEFFPETGREPDHEA